MEFLQGCPDTDSTMQEPRPDECLQVTATIDFEHETVRSFVADNSVGGSGQIGIAVALYYAVRDQLRYDPYAIGTKLVDYTASKTLASGRGWCVTKAIVYAACLRAVGIPARLGYADVRNHLSTENLRRLMGTDVFLWHGYTDVFLDGAWVKATPAFNVELCEKFRLKPLDFDGLEDSIYHPFDKDGRKHMEYLNHRGAYADLPFESMMADFRRYYPYMTAHMGGGNFDREVDRETSGLSQDGRG